MSVKSEAGLSEYNAFCKGLIEGNILYNMDKTNLWAEYLVVANVIPVRVGNVKTYTVLLLGLRKQNGKYTPINQRISLTPDYARHTPFLKVVGYCKYRLLPEMTDVEVNVGLAAVYGSTDLHKFATKLSIKKPRHSKYDSEGKLVIKNTNN